MMSEVATIEPAGDIALVAPVDVTNSMAMLARAAADPSVSPEKMDALYNIAARMREDEAKGAFQRAMAKAQAEMRPVVRDATNSHTNSRYARLETIDNAIRPIYTAHGFSLSFNTEPLEGHQVRILCDVAHTDGHSKRYQIDGALDAAGAQGKANKTAIQALGSTVSYLQRYLTKLVFNITLADEDNDGNRTRSGYREQAKPEPSDADLERGVETLAKKLVAAKSHDALRTVKDRERVQERIDYLRGRDRGDLADRLTAAESAAMQMLGPEE